MAPINKSSVNELLNENSVSDFLSAAEVLLKLANNILNNPANPKYRRLRLTNDIVKSKLLPVCGAMACLFDMGFIEDGEFLSMPDQSPLTSLSSVRDDIQKETERCKERNGSKLSTPSVQSSQVASAVMRPDLQASEMTFLTKLRSNLLYVMKYEDDKLQEKARKIIPIQELMKISESHYESMQKAQEPGSSTTLDIQDYFLLELLKWFKTTFFSWVNSPKCDICGGKTSLVGMVEPFPQELRWTATRVENYQCDICKGFSRFPRYNDAEKLLETRRGRCGEWANCFTLCCRSVGFEARYVLDWTDHVWTEVYSTCQKRWLHCDPCENICDKPLLYEVGWGKKLSYVIAFSKEEVVDVTWRYSAKHKEVLSRRNECRENWLVDTIFRLNSEKQLSLATSKKQILQQRLVTELVEFTTPKSGDGQDLSGRTSGSTAWRMARGEIGSLSKPKEPFVFHLQEKEKSNQMLHLQYNATMDCYFRRYSDGIMVSGYASCVFEEKNIFRKEEQDWKMVYLARIEGSSTAEITWKFDFCDSEYIVDYIEMTASSKTYESGIVSWKLCSGDICAIVMGSNDVQTIRDLQGCSDICLTAILTGGEGDIAWQHTQLFRQSTQDTSSFPLDIKIHLSQKNSPV